MKLILIFSLMLGLSACVKISDSDSPAAAPKAAEPVPIKGGTDPVHRTSDVGAAALVRALPEPNRYQVAISVHPEAQLIRRSLVSAPDSFKLLSLPSSGNELIDSQVESNQDYLYEQGVVQDGQFQILHSEKVHIPKDLEIRSEVTLTQDEKNWVIDGRLFFYESGIITTNGFTLILKVGKLIAESGTIRSFPKGSKAGVGLSGTAGGIVRVQSGSANGQLKVEMRGQHGGDGIKGADCKEYSKCPPAPIEYKTNGLAGFPGGDGLGGGNSGSFQLVLADANQILILLTSEYGLGGLGGAGGAGTPRDLNWNLQEGPPGRMGAPGTAGMVERSYIQDANGQRLL